jgi:DNA-binding HxlR family transcriptional regulator
VPEGRGKIDTSHENCQAVADTLDRIGDKWTVLVVGASDLGPLRYNEIRPRRTAGIRPLLADRYFSANAFSTT